MTYSVYLNCLQNTVPDLEWFTTPGLVTVALDLS